MALEATITLPVRRVSTSQHLDKTVLEVLPKDLAFCIDAIFAQELQEQIRQSNPPSNVIRGKFRNRAFFADLEDIKRATAELLSALQRLTRVLTGRAQSSYRVEEREFSRLIVGPLVPYTRKLYWNPAGNRVVSKRKLADIGNVRYVKVSVVPMHKLAIRLVKRSYPHLTIVEVWTKTDNGRTPGIYIGPKRKGLLN